MSEPIYARLEHDIEAGWDTFRRHLPGRDYHDPDASATPAPEAPMSLLATLEADAEEVRAKVEDFVKAKIPAALADAQKVEAWLATPGAQDVLDALTGNSHLPELALQELASMISTVGRLYAPETAAPAPADPAMGEQPVAAPAAS